MRLSLVPLDDSHALLLPNIIRRRIIMVRRLAAAKSVIDFQHTSRTHQACLQLSVILLLVLIVWQLAAIPLPFCLLFKQKLMAQYGVLHWQIVNGCFRAVN